MDYEDNHATEEKLNIDGTKLQEERRNRNKQKKATKKLEKQRDREQKELLKLQPKSNNVTLISRDFADKIVGSTSGTASCTNEPIDTDGFPVLTSSGSRIIKRYTFPSLFVETKSDKKKLIKLELSDFLCAPSTSTKQTKSLSGSLSEGYSGNHLDSDMPIRRRGKHREIPKPKNRSKLKQDILSEQKDYKENGETIESCLLLETDLCDNVMTKELDDAVNAFISGVVGLQERLYNRDAIKGVAKRRYVVGLHEAKKYLKLNRAKMIIIAPDIKLTKCDGVLFRTIKEVIDLIHANNIHYIFALKRKLLGMLTLKYIPVSCVVILNYEGLEEQLKNVLKVLPLLRKQKCVKLESIENDANVKFLNSLMEALKSK